MEITRESTSRPEKAQEKTYHFFIIQEYAAQGTLAELLACADMESRQPQPSAAFVLTLQEKLEISLQIARALSFLHNSELRTFHRDVKAENILVSSISQVVDRKTRVTKRRFEIKLSDFGQVIECPQANSEVAPIKEILHPFSLSVSIKTPAHEKELKYCCIGNCSKAHSSANTEEAKIKFNELPRDR